MPNLIVSDHDLKCLFRAYLEKLESLADDDVEKLNSMDLLSCLMSSEDHHYRNIEIIMHILSSAAVKMGVESIVESWVSLYKYHSSNIRPISDERAEKEIQLRINGPNFQHADSIIQAGLKLMFKIQKISRIVLGILYVDLQT